MDFGHQAQLPEDVTAPVQQLELHGGRNYCIHPSQVAPSYWHLSEIQQMVMEVDIDMVFAVELLGRQVLAARSSKMPRIF